MINRVVLAGRLLDDPTTHTTPTGGRYARLNMEVRHPYFGTRGSSGCRVEARLFNERQIDPVMKYMEQGRDLMITGHLEREGEELVVSAENVSFMLRGLSTRYFDNEAFTDPVAA